MGACDCVNNDAQSYYLIATRPGVESMSTL